jgi:hypothetical protein
MGCQRGRESARDIRQSAGFYQGPAFRSDGKNGKTTHLDSSTLLRPLGEEEGLKNMIFTRTQIRATADPAVNCAKLKQGVVSK